LIMLAACADAEATADQEQAVASTEPATDARLALDAIPDAERAEASPRSILAVSRNATAAVAPAGRTTCRNIIGWMIDPASEGRNVRDEPSVNASRLGVIPPPLQPDQNPNEMLLPVEFTILGSENGWLHIRGAHYDESLAGGPVPAVFSGEGWVSGRGIRVGLQTRAAFSAPSHGSAVLIGGGDNDYLDGWTQRGIAGCQGQWVLVDWERPTPAFEGQTIASWAEAAVVNRNPFTLRAWAAGVCNIIETTCDGVDGTEAETAFRD
jgi:hypothetical protein